MGNKIKYMCMAVMAASMLTSCNGQGPAEEPVKLQGTIDKAVADYPAASEYDATLLQGINGFAYDMAQRLAVDGENYFFSPYSLCQALSVLDNAAGGETKRQIEDLLHISDLMEWNMQMGLYGLGKESQEEELTCANSLWIDKQCELSEDIYEKYLPTVEEYYFVQSYQADFKKNPEQTKEQINRWISENTGGMIKSFNDQVDQDTVLSLINAVYFYGEWSYPFEANDTAPQTFHGTKEESTVSMMHQGGIWLSYYEKDGLCGLSLPYGEGSIVMNIVMPKQEEQGAPESESQKTEDRQEVSAVELFWRGNNEDRNAFLTSLMAADTVRIQRLRMPKFQADYMVDELIGLLEDMGLVNAFDSVKAEFPGIGNVYVSNAAHKAKLEVDELGSRAAAVTEFAVEGTAEDIVDDYVEFVVDRPFLFTIQDKQTGMILFMGQVNNLEGIE